MVGWLLGPDTFITFFIPVLAFFMADFIALAFMAFFIALGAFMASAIAEVRPRKAKPLA